MTENFPHPPIIEAMLDIRTILPLEINLENLLSYHEEIKDRFPEKSRRVQWKSDIQIKQEKALEVATSGGPDGYLFRSPKENKVVQVRLDGFTFNQLKPYTGWKFFSDEARELWNLYVKITRPQKVLRLALRYINRIKIPLPLKAFKEYVTTVPEIAEGMPNALSHFLMQLVVPDEKTGNIATITETFERQTDASAVALIFDIDTYHEKNLAADSNEIWQIMESLARYKNEIFLSSMTDKAKDLFR